MKIRHVKLLFDFESLPAGTVFEIEAEDERSYSGLWSSHVGTYYISIPKHLCELLPAQSMIEKYFALE